MEAMGGRANWDATRYITWRFFGGRLHIWDKSSGNIRYEDDNTVVVMNIHSQRGDAWDRGTRVTQPDTLAKRLTMAYRRWINDSYWLVMPYKLKDSGVTLKYKEEAALPDGRAADVLVLTFENVGVTPQNKYEVSVSRDRHLVEQWSFYRNASDPEPRFTMPWANWQRYGSILLNDNFGERQHSDIAVLEDVPAAAFESSAPVNLPAGSR